MEPEQVRQFVSKAARCNARAAFESGIKSGQLRPGSHPTGGGLRKSFSTPSHNLSGSRSPAFASVMIF